MASSKGRGLGRGLDALLPQKPGGAGLQEVPVVSIAPNPRQPRQRISSEQLSELAASIREHGVLQPLVVTKAPQGSSCAYHLVTGERRWRAARMAGLEKVPVVVRDVSPVDMLEWALVENIQREDLNPLEEAQAYRTLMDEFDMTQEEVARRVGKSRAAVANVVRLLNLPEFARRALAEGKITEGHARALVSLESEEQQRLLLDLVVEKGLNVRQTEALARRMREPKKQEVVQEAADAMEVELRRLAERMQDSLGTKVELLRGRKGGRLVIHFYSDEELEEIYRRLVG